MTVVRPQRNVQSPGTATRLDPFDVLVLAAWCGLAAGELEVAARVVYRALSSTQRLYLMTRHFVWLGPLINLALFVTLGAALVAAMHFWPRHAGWIGPRLIVAFALFPTLALCGRNIYIEAWLLVALGIAMHTVSFLERHRDRWRRRLVATFPGLLVLVLLQAAFILGRDRLKEWREDGRPLPFTSAAAAAPNVLLIVLDTVRADHLGLYGYPRPTSPNLDRLARRGVRFDRARAAAPWTLASHANMFTGRWPHELDLKWTCPLPANVPTIAEVLQASGYATAGFAGNTFYCSYDSGLDRGFTHYEDYVLDTLAALRTVHVIKESLKTLDNLGNFLPISRQKLRSFCLGDRKDARVVNREFLDWLSARRRPDRPFFAFLNYIDAHAPYLLPADVSYRFGSAPKTEAQERLLADDWTKVDKTRLPRAAITLARDAYDNCLAHLDAQLGLLVDELERRGLLEDTLVIVAGDHGEGFGEHQLFEHGESLYRPEIRVPLLVVLPARYGSSSQGAVSRFVSLRDVAATIAAFAAPKTKSSFPGRSLLESEIIRSSSFAPTPGAAGVGAVLSELASPNPSDPNQGRSPAYRGPLISLAEDDYVYIRTQGNRSEELFNVRDDPNELNDLARDDQMLPVLRRFRDRLKQVLALDPEARRPAALTGVATESDRP